jgi:hypothetical protein
MGAHPQRPGDRRRRGPGHRPRRVRCGGVPPGHTRRARGHHPARPDRRRHRRQDGRQPARGEEPGRRVLAAGRGALRHRGARPCRPASCAAASASWPSTTSSAAATSTRSTSTSGWRLRGDQGRGGRLRRARVGPPGDPQLRPHPRPCHRDRRRASTSATARRWRWASSTRPRSPTLGRIDAERVAEHRRVVAAYGLPDSGCRPVSTPTRSSNCWPATRRPSTGSPSSSTETTASSRSTTSTRPVVRDTLATVRGVPMTRPLVLAPLRGQPRHARRTPARDLRHHHARNRPSWPPPSGPTTTASSSSTSSPTTRVPSSTPSSRHEAGRQRS